MIHKKLENIIALNKPKGKAKKGFNRLSAVNAVVSQGRCFMLASDLLTC